MEICSDWFDENYYQDCFNLGLVKNLKVLVKVITAWSLTKKKSN